MGTPVFLQLAAADDLLVQATTSATITSESASPAGNARVAVAFYTRRDSDQTHDSVTAGFSTVAGFTKLEDFVVEDPAGTFHRLSLWEATTTASPGSGTITATASATVFQRALGGGAVANVGSKVIDASASNTTGTTVTVTLTGATTGDVAFVAGFSREDATVGWTWSDGLTDASNSPVASGTAFTFGMGLKVSPSATQTISGLTTDQAHGVAGVLYRGAA